MKLYRSCYWEWVASNSSLRECWCLLHHWTSDWMCSWIQDKTSSSCKHPVLCKCDCMGHFNARMANFIPSLFQGIWWGLIIGVFVQTVTLIVITARTNWNKEVRRIPTAGSCWILSCFKSGLCLK